MKPRNAGETEVGSHEETEHSQEKNRNRKPRRNSRSRKSRRESARTYESELLVPFCFSIIFVLCLIVSLFRYYFTIISLLTATFPPSKHPHQPASCMIIRVTLGSCRKYKDLTLKKSKPLNKSLQIQQAQPQLLRPPWRASPQRYESKTEESLQLWSLTPCYQFSFSVGSIPVFCGLYPHLLENSFTIVFQ